MCCTGRALASLALAADSAAGCETESELERRRRRVEKLRWQLRIARRAVAAKRKEWEALGLERRPQGLDRAVAWGLLAGGAAGVALVQALTWLVFP